MQIVDGGVDPPVFGGVVRKGAPECPLPGICGVKRLRCSVQTADRQDRCCPGLGVIRERRQRIIAVAMAQKLPPVVPLERLGELVEKVDVSSGLVRELQWQTDDRKVIRSMGGLPKPGIVVYIWRRPLAITG